MQNLEPHRRENFTLHTWLGIPFIPVFLEHSRFYFLRNFVLMSCKSYLQMTQLPVHFWKFKLHTKTWTCVQQPFIFSRSLNVSNVYTVFFYVLLHPFNIYLWWTSELCTALPVNYLAPDLCIILQFLLSTTRKLLGLFNDMLSCSDYMALNKMCEKWIWKDFVQSCHDLFWGIWWTKLRGRTDKNPRKPLTIYLVSWLMTGCMVYTKIHQLCM